MCNVFKFISQLPFFDRIYIIPCKVIVASYKYFGNPDSANGFLLSDNAISGTISLMVSPNAMLASYGN